MTTAPIFALPRDAKRLFRRLAAVPIPDSATARRVATILADCRKRGVRGVIDWTRRLDGVVVTAKTLEIPRKAIGESAYEIPVGLAREIRFAWKRILAFHETFARAIPRKPIRRREPGILAAVLPTPLRRVGIYVPGGTAPLFSTLLMAGAAARAARVGEIVVATPPRRDGAVAPAIRYAAFLVGAKSLYRVGGVQAIAALAYGAGPIAPVEKIVGPGNRFVAEAKRQVFGWVGIESVAGPSEVVIVADARADATEIAADLLAQAEHDPDARAILLTPSRPLVRAVDAQLRAQLRALPRRAVAAKALALRGALVVTRTLDEALAIADEIAPEHLILRVRGDLPDLPRAGAIFLDGTPEVLGDYVAGPNHILPTGGAARYASALSPLDFLRWPTLLSVDARGRTRLGPAAARLARAEGLEAHARATEGGAPQR